MLYVSAVQEEHAVRDTKTVKEKLKEYRASNKF